MTDVLLGIFLIGPTVFVFVWMLVVGFSNDPFTDYPRIASLIRPKWLDMLMLVPAVVGTAVVVLAVPALFVAMLVSWLT